MKTSLLFITGIGLLISSAYAQQQDSTQQIADETILSSEDSADIPVFEPSTEVYEGLGDPIFKVNEEENEEEEFIPRITYRAGNDTPSPSPTPITPSRIRPSDGMKTLSGSVDHSGGFGAISFRYSDFRYENIVMAGVRAGWIINRTLGIGFEGHGIVPSTRYVDVDPYRDAVLLGGYGGMFLELILFSNQVFHLTFPVSAGAGWLGYNQHWENDFSQTPGGLDPLIDDDTFWYVEPGANIEVNVSRNFRMCFGISRRFLKDFELINSNENSFENLNYYMTLKFGKF